MPTGDKNKKELTPEQEKEKRITQAYDSLTDGTALNLKLGSTNKKVKDLQVILGLPETGTFGNVTKNALIEWQTQRGIKGTGVTDIDTVTQIVQASLNRMLSGKKDFEEEIGSGVGFDVVDLNTKFGGGGTPTESQIFNTNNAFNVQDLSARMGIEEPIVEEPAPSPLEPEEVEKLEPKAKVESSNISEGLTETPAAPAMTAAKTIAPTQIPAPAPSLDMFSFESLFGIGPMPLTSEPEKTQPVNAAQVAAANNTFVEATTTAVNNSSKVTSDVNNTLYNNYMQAVTAQNTATEQINNINNLTNPQVVNQITNNTSQIQQNTQQLAPIAASMTAPIGPQPMEESTVAGEPTARVETNELISTSTVNQIVKPANPVVTSVEMMGAQVSNSIQNLGSDLTSTVSNIKAGDQISSSNVTQVDQSSIYNMPGEPTQPAQTPMTEQPRPEQPTQNMNNVMLSAIYELLASGIKVKITY